MLVVCGFFCYVVSYEHPDQIENVISLIFLQRQIVILNFERLADILHYNIELTITSTPTQVFKNCQNQETIRQY